MNRSRKRSPNPHSKICAHCGMEFSPHKQSNNTNRFCSRRCKKRNYRIINRDRVNALKKLSYLRNKAHVLSARMRYYKSHKKACHASAYQWRKRNPEKAKEIVRRASAKLVSELRDSYVVQKLRGGTTTRFVFPPELIEAKRQHIKLLRLCKQNDRTTSTNSANLC